MGDVARVLAVTGTKREAAVLRHAGVDVLAIGGRPEGLAGHSAPYCGIVSFGMAGALSPDLRIGDWVIGERLTGAVEAQCDAQWRAALARALPNARIGTVYADGRLIGDPGEKQALHRLHGALAADMESHIVAKAAAQAGVPFAILRCVSDEAAHALPEAIAVAMRPDGGLALGAILGSILAHPGQLADIARMLARFNRAYASLSQGPRGIPAGLALELA